MTEKDTQNAGVSRPDWDRIDTVLLDMDGTLLDLHFDAHFWHEHLPARYADIHQMTVEQAKAEIMPRLREMEGALQWYCLDHWTREFSVDIAALKREIEHMIDIHPYVTDFLQAVREAGKRVILTTNAHRDSLSLKMEKTELEPYFDRLICAHDYGYAKEDQGFWAALQGDEPFEPLRTLLIDDNLTVLNSAAKYGIAHLFGVHRPNSQQAPVTMADYPLVYNYEDLLDGLV